MEGKKVGDYDILSKLGTGGFGTVWKAKAHDGTPVAMKILNPQALDNERVVKKFFHEAMILAKLDHKNITRLMEFFPDGSNYAIAMEYVEGITLKDFIKENKRKVPYEQALNVAAQTLRAFQYANENGIIHRDIKPGNIMIDKNNTVKIMDFGIARISTTASHETASQMLSIQYAAPERFQKGAEIDSRSDIYSLGIVFYELFTGIQPFTGDETFKIIYGHINEAPEPPTKHSDTISEEVNQAILKALEKKPEDRFQTCREFSEAIEPGESILDDVTREIDLSVTQIGPITGEEYLEKKRPIFLMALISVAVIGIALGGYLVTKNYLFQEREPVTVTATGTKAEPGEIINKKGFAEIKHPKDNSVMISIPEGEFTMGSGEYAAEKPVQKIYLDRYYIDKFLVTNAQFKKFVEETQYITDAEKEGYGMVRIGRRWKRVKEANWKTPDGLTSIEGKDDNPVTQVSYNDALAYCQWAGKDLPTEAQWEKAARGLEGNEYPWGNSEPDDTMANFDNIIGSTTPVTDYEKGQSFYGSYDMAGNVYQWCKDWYATGARKEKNPTGPDTGKEHVVKGGSFIEGTESLRSANRDRYEPNYRSYLFGFRCALKKS